MLPSATRLRTRFCSSRRSMTIQSVNLRPSTGSYASLSAVGAVALTLITGLTEPKTRRCLKLTPRYIAEMLAEIAYAMTALLHLEVLHAKELKQEIVPRATGYE